MTQTPLFPTNPFNPAFREQLQMHVTCGYREAFCDVVRILANRREYIYLDEGGVPVIQRMDFTATPSLGLQVMAYTPVLRDGEVVATLSIDLGDMRDMDDSCVFMFRREGSSLWLSRKRYEEQDAIRCPGVTAMLSRLDAPYDD